MLHAAVLRRALLLLGLSAVFAMYVASGVRGVDFGNMWDEDYQIEGLQHSVKTLSLMQDGYYYGGLYYTPGYLVLAPTFLRPMADILAEIRATPSRPFTPESYPSLVSARDSALQQLARPGFKREDRRVCVWISAFGILWVFLASYFASGSRWAALAAAAAVGLCYELSYHSRWIAVDAMLAQITGLCLLFVMLAFGASNAPRERLFLRLAACVAGLGIGAKMPGVFLLVPVLVAVGWSSHAKGLRERLVRAVEAGLIAFAVFVVTTPGVLLDPIHFIGDMLRVQWEYNNLPESWPYTVMSYPARLGRIAVYLGMVLFSPSLPIALLCTGLVLFGAFIAVRERQPKLLAVIAFLVVYIGFVSLQRLMIVRNFMSTLPGLAILFAVGLQRCAALAARVKPLPWRAARVKPLPWLLAAGYLAICVLHAAWMWRAAESITTTTAQSVSSDLLDYLQASPGRKFYISKQVVKELKLHDPDRAHRISSASWQEAEEIVLHRSQVPGWKANTAKYATYFAMQLANFDYYPGMLRGPAFVALRKDRALELGLGPARLK